MAGIQEDSCLGSEATGLSIGETSEMFTVRMQMVEIEQDAMCSLLPDGRNVRKVQDWGVIVVGSSSKQEVLQSRHGLRPHVSSCQ